jgi:membrane protease YdiL (CAAX protease family)
MNDKENSSHFHPIIQLVILILIAALCGFVAVLAGFAIYGAIYSFAPMLEMIKLRGEGMDMRFLKILQISSTAGLFILGPLVYAKIDNYRVRKYFGFNTQINPFLILLTILIVVFSSPLIEYINELNQKMALPHFLQNVEAWMKAKELEADQLIQKILIMKSYKDFAINLLMIAILPAIGEELMFRGTLQHIFTTLFKNAHIAIWITAILFSAIHLQFFGFFPRMFLGAMFGYMFVWSKNIWLPILAHFCVNGKQVILAFKLQQEGKTIAEMDSGSSFQWYTCLISALLTIVLLWLYHKNSTKNNIATYE